MVHSPGRIIRAALEQEGLVLVTAGNMIAVVLGAVVWLVLARMLAVADYGRANFVLSIGALTASFSTLGLPLTVQTYLPRGEDDLVPSSVLLVILASLALGIPLALVHPAVPLIVLSNALFILALKERLGRRKYGNFALLQGASRIAILGAILALVPLWGVNGVLYSFPLVYLALSSWLLIRLRGVWVRRSLGTVKRYAGFALTALLTTAIASMGVRLDKVLIGAIYGDTTLGYYQLAFHFYSAMLVVPTSLGSYLLPEKSSGRRTRLTELVGLALSVLTALLGFATIPLVVRKLFPKYYPISSEAAQLMALAIVFDAAYSIWSAGKFSGGKPRAVLSVSSISLLVFVAMILLLGSTVGVIGLAISLLVYRALASALGVLEGRISDRAGSRRS